MTDDIAQVRDVIMAGTAARSAFDYLLAHAQAADFALVCRDTATAKVVEFQLRGDPRSAFAAEAAPKHVNYCICAPVLAGHPGLDDAAARRFIAVGSTKPGEFCTHIGTVEDARAVLDFLREQHSWPEHRHAQRFLSETFRSITPEHLLRAAERLVDGFANHAFGPSRKFDLLFNDYSLAPKAVFGVAASEALGFPVGPENFSGGEDTTCFRILRKHGYAIVEKGQAEILHRALVNDEDRTWSEGKLKLVAHLRRERGTGLASAKREQFRARHGRLFCERCSMDPAEAYGDAGEACIEIHHREMRVADMSEMHRTTLDDLQCLCANCHRVTHRELKAKIEAAEGHHG